MPTFRKSLLAAVCLIAFIVILRASRSSDLPNAPGFQPVEKIFEEKENAKAHPETQEKKSKEQQQQHLGASATAPLRERLRYQFPYDLEPSFPAYIWQTWKYQPSSYWFAEELRVPEASWTDMNPGFVHEVIPDDTQRDLIKYLYGMIPDVFEAYDSMPLAVLKADFFRYLILLARGGIYSDIDTHAIQPVIHWLPEKLDKSTVGLVVGIEADPDRPDWADWYSRRLQFCQWTIMSKPGHPILRDIVVHITEHALRMKRAGILKKGKMDRTVVEFTGPGAWTDAVFRYFNNPEYFNIQPGDKNITYEDFTQQVDYRKVGDTLVLPITSFSPGVGQMGAEDIDHPMAFVKHDFGGKISWCAVFTYGINIYSFRDMENRPLALNNTTLYSQPTTTIITAIMKTVRSLRNEIDRFDACSATIKLRPAVTSRRKRHPRLTDALPFFGEADRAMRPNHLIRGLFP
jgi:alpha 1,6-mannosyltransferase